MGGIVVVIVVIVILSISLSVGYATDTSEENRYTSGDARLNSLDTFFCEGAKVSSNDYAESAPISVYLLSKEPPLTDRNDFTINNIVNIEENAYEYWHFYLHPGSNITLKACTTNSPSYYFYIIEGSSNFNRWKNNPSSRYAKTSLYVSNDCSQGNQTQSYNVTNTGHYYLSYYTSFSEAKGRQSLYIERYEYSTDNISSRQSCQVSASHSSCSVNTYMSSQYNKVLIKVPFDPVSDFDSPYTINYKCLPRPSAYAIVTVIPVVVIVSCCIVLLIGIICFLRSKRKNYETLASPVKADAPPSPNPSYQ